MSEGPADARPVAVRHDLDHVPLAPPARSYGMLEVFRRRYLLRLMVRREIQARYAGTGFGLAWSYINPLTRFATFYVIFGILLGRGMGLQNFAIHLFAGMVVLNYFTETVTAGTKSLLNNRSVIGKMAMPREMFPIASMLVSLWHAFPQLVILTIACVLTGVLGSGPLWVPDLVGMGAAALGFALMMTLGTALGLMFSCINVIFRDFQRIVQTFINMAQFSAPMMYPYWVTYDRFPGVLHDIYVLNPIAEAVMLVQRGFWYPTCTTECVAPPERIAKLLGDNPTAVDDLFTRGFVMLGVSVVLLFIGQWLFKRLEKTVPERL